MPLPANPVRVACQYLTENLNGTRLFEVGIISSFATSRNPFLGPLFSSWVIATTMVKCGLTLGRLYTPLRSYSRCFLASRPSLWFIQCQYIKCLLPNQRGQSFECQFQLWLFRSCVRLWQYNTCWFVSLVLRWACSFRNLWWALKALYCHNKCIQVSGAFMGFKSWTAKHKAVDGCGCLNTYSNQLFVFQAIGKVIQMYANYSNKASCVDYRDTDYGNLDASGWDYQVRYCLPVTSFYDSVRNSLISKVAQDWFGGRIR